MLTLSIYRTNENVDDVSGDMLYPNCVYVSGLSPPKGVTVKDDYRMQHGGWLGNSFSTITQDVIIVK